MNHKTVILYRPAQDTGHTGLPMVERYADIQSTDPETTTVLWNGGGPHIFNTRTGQCIESTNGAMRGFHILPEEIERLRDELLEPASPVPTSSTKKSATRSSKRA